MACFPADGSENDHTSANGSALLTEVEALRLRLAAIEARLPGNALQESPGRQARRRTSTKTFVRLTAGAILAILAAASVAYGASAVDALFISNEGKVGIGTSSPAAKLHVAGSGWFGVDSADSLNASAGAGIRVFQDDRQGYGSVFSYDYKANAPRNLVLQQPGGNVGIGKTSPGDKLYVDGIAHVAALNVTGIATMKSMSMPDQGVEIGGTSGRNMFSDEENARSLRVGAAWSTPGIYSQKGDVVVGSESRTVWLVGKVAITNETNAEKRHQPQTLYVDGGIKATGAVDGNMKIVYQRDDEPQRTFEKPNWRYHMSLTATNYGGKTKTIPKETLRALCGTADGCEIRLGMTRWDDSAKTQTASRSFRFYYSPNDGHWRSSDDNEGVIGRDGRQDVANIWSTCYLTDATFDKYQDLGDKNTGMQLLVWNGNSNAARTCEITLIP